MAKNQVINPKGVDLIAKDLSRILSATFVLYVKTLHSHWNVIDSRFISLHKFFEEIYEELADAIDEIAERIRGLQKPSPGSMKKFIELSFLKERSTITDGDVMLKELLKDHETLCREIRPLISLFQDFGDEGSADLLIDRLRVHEKTAWMLRSHL